ncbi:hypothetical protein PTT_07612 [Pyrenophora teres f. teres 0-1]|uniref:Uncharacterized protein n=1 Tax=Pyrenophora teres f. teres (strain 0-1) TaxID=861557 RepID=E3RI18_PYRTT|nr:hypothetical protein PTT_07612 [Pyrenophora teres f. teres 0-1]
MPNVPNHIILDEANGIISCALHKFALLPANVYKHFDEEHKGETSTEERRAIQAAVDKLGQEVVLRQSYEDFSIPTQVVAAYPGLALHKASHRCRKCGVVRGGQTAQHNMENHLRQEHSIYVPPKLTTLSRKSWYSTHVHIAVTQRFFASVPPQYRDLQLTRKFEINITSILRIPGHTIEPLNKLPRSFPLDDISDSSSLDEDTGDTIYISDGDTHSAAPSPSTLLQEQLNSADL